MSPSPAPSAAPRPTGPTALGASVTFFGRGWGHGVGLSQYGARGRAQAGQDARTILAHYYARTTIGSIDPARLVRVLVLDDAVPTPTSPVVIYGRRGAWRIAGSTATYPADARLRLIPTSTGSTTAWRVVVDVPSGAKLLDAAAPASLRVEPAADATILQLWSKVSVYDLYRGTLRVIASGPRVDIVNELPLESYLRGVVPAEMPSSWPSQALAAQAIAARSYAAYRLRPGVSTFDLYDDTRSQMYLGVRRETPATDAAVAATRGQVLRSGTSLVNAVYHSTGGGATEDNESSFTSASGAVTAGPLPYLRGSSDRDAAGVPYDAGAPYATWRSATYSLARLSTIFAADPRTSVGTLRALDLRARGVSGRLIRVTLIGSGGSKTVSGNVFVAVFNAGRPLADPPLRSALLDTVPVP